MSLIQDKQRFQEFAEDIGNPYMAVNLISSWTRDILKKYDNKLLTSEVLTWVIQGKSPKSIVEFNEQGGRVFMRGRKSKSDIEDLLCYIDDEELCNAVRNSYEESCNKKELTFVYGSILDKGRQARLRILMRMLFCKR